MDNTLKSRPWVAWLVALGSLGVYAEPLFRHRFHLGDDSLVTLFRFRSFYACLREASLPCWWATDLSFNLGAPVFIFYPTVALWAAAALKVFGFSYSRALELSALLHYSAFFAAAYLLARRFSTRSTSVLVAVVASWAPYKLLNIGHRGAYSEAWAMVALIVVLRAWLWCIEDPKRAQETTLWRLLALAASLVLLLLSHPLIASMFIAPFALWHILLWKDVRRCLKPLATAYGLALGIGCFKWLPILVEQNLTHMRGALTAGFFVYSNHFYIPWFELVVPVRTPWPARIGIFLLAGIALALVSRAIAYRGRSASQEATESDIPAGGYLWAALACCAFSSFLVLGASSGLWSVIPTLKYAQFPWRFSGIAIAFSLVPAAVGYEWLSGWLARFLGKYSHLLVTMAVSVGAVAWFHPGATPKLQSDERDAHFFSSTYFRQHSLHGAVDYLPRTVTSPDVFYAEPFSIDIVEPEVAGTATVLRAKRYQQRYETHVQAGDSGSNIRFMAASYPGWKGYVDGKRVAVLAPDEDMLGRVRIAVPAGEHRVELRFGFTWWRFLAYAISALSLAGIAVVLGYALRQGRRLRDTAPG